ncbi:iron-containing alcohol dehydrogenase [Desulfovibrio sp. UCD-KL4C]|uniref:iron-containing alcohol dehydrogenase family protein n=1 Tax=Desulfovibrio sp. UCD-KL4C TaxID=2578120 RepID=UPI0025C260D6|nr:iron-containing alcohol dehydrogenase [Desulfovibrio sp. UCD-KL4C]
MTINLPTNIIFTSDTCIEISKKLDELNCCSACIVTGMNSTRKTGLLDLIQTELAKKNISHITHSISAEPESNSVDVLSEKILASNSTAVIALGGGSVIDASKSAALQSINKLKFSNIEFGTTNLNNALPIIAVPTVSGSGSEITPYSVINNSQTGRKSTIYHKSLFPCTTIIDQNIFVTVSRKQTLAGALDILVHCLEAYTSAQSQILINAFAIQGASLVFSNLQTVLDNPQDIEARRALAEASLYGGASIAHVRTGAMHTLSVALQKYSKLPHGMLNATLLPAVLSFNIDHYRGKLANFISACGFAATKDQEAADILTKLLSNYISFEESPFSVPEEAILSVVDRVKQDQGLLQVNARPLSDTIINELVTSIAKDEQYHA